MSLTKQLEQMVEEIAGVSNQLLSLESNLQDLLKPIPPAAPRPPVAPSQAPAMPAAPEPAPTASPAVEQVEAVRAKIRSLISQIGKLNDRIDL